MCYDRHLLKESRMKTGNRQALTVLAVVGLIALGSLPGCSTSQAENLDLTYYFLPG
jgi:hypothetical protein